MRHWLRAAGANMMKARVSRTASFSLFFLVSGFAPAHAQAIASAAPTEAPSPLSAIAHDFTTWLSHVGGANKDRTGRHSLPLPRPRPVVSNMEWSEFVPPPSAFKKKMPTPVQINDLADHLRSNSGSFAIFAAIRRAASLIMVQPGRIE